MFSPCIHVSLILHIEVFYLCIDGFFQLKKLPERSQSSRITTSDDRESMLEQIRTRVNTFASQIVLLEKSALYTLFRLRYRILTQNLHLIDVFFPVL